jgi:hypothetical protein
MPQPSLAIAFRLDTQQRAIVSDALADMAKAVYLVDLDEAGRQSALRNATVLLAVNTAKDLRSGEADLLRGARLIQFITAGVRVGHGPRRGQTAAHRACCPGVWAI